MMFLAVILLLVGGYYLLRHSGNPEFQRSKTADAEEILKRRFVAGEIDEATYERMLKTIRS